jgi:hypothetical protein
LKKPKGLLFIFQESQIFLNIFNKNSTGPRQNCSKIFQGLPFKEVDDLEVELLFPLPLLLRGKLEVSVQHACTPI